jgi:NAD(P)-dependent dehydrogenase (short-subunit alcohol dehydrogenase family)
MIQDHQIALATGANKGIGLEIARQLAQARRGGGLRLIQATSDERLAERNLAQSLQGRP